MWPRNDGVLALFALFLTVDVLESCSPKSCKVGLESKKPACGSDGLSYFNRCHLELARCHNQNVTFVHRGNCRVYKTCADYSKVHPNYKFKPQCRNDGNFAAGQCHAQIGYCWCVTPQGQPIPFSATKYKPGMKHRCGRGKKTTRSSPKNRRAGRVCRREDKALFNSNLIQIFTSEFNRDNPVKGVVTNDKMVLDWKFDLMDTDRSEHLDKTEYRDLRRLVKKVVKPKRCAKSFAKACDMNRDQVIGRQEWAQCLTRDGMDDGRSGDDNNGDEDEDEEDDGEEILSPYRPSSILTDGSRTITSGSNLDDDSSERRDEDATDCLSDRKTAAALDEDYQLYVPECTLDGRYAKVQCYKSAGYCWCVNEDTGKNIAGTAVKDQIPKCDQIVTASRPMKGCPDDKKITFLKDLMDYLHVSMVKETNSTSIPGIGGSSWRSSKEEQVASWSFVFFDKNKNKVLDKIEWKGFKDTMAGVKNLKRCGKKLPRYCDINKDRHISMTEWLDCLNTQRYQEQLATSTLSSLMKTGKNPLSLLMED